MSFSVILNASELIINYLHSCAYKNSVISNAVKGRTKYSASVTLHEEKHNEHIVVQAAAHE